MCFCNYFRGDNSEFFDDDYINDMEFYDIPEFCPYRNYFSDTLEDDYMYRMPNPSSPPGPPPSAAPSKQMKMGGGPELKAVEPGAIKPCVYSFVYIWPKRGHGFWAWLTFVGRKSASGFKWNGYRWVYFGIDLRQIDSFECY